MQRRAYAVWWMAGDGRRHAGRLEVDRRHARFSGNGNGALSVPLDQIATVDYGRGEMEIRLRDESRLRVGSLDAPGALRECAGDLAVKLLVPHPR